MGLGKIYRPTELSLWWRFFRGRIAISEHEVFLTPGDDDE